jgi:hypothetical protein
MMIRRNVYAQALYERTLSRPKEGGVAQAPGGGKKRGPEIKKENGAGVAPRTTRFTSPADLVTTTLSDPVTLTTGTASTSGLQITNTAGVSLGHHSIECQASDATIKVVLPPAGGLKTNGVEMRAYNTAGTAYAAWSGLSTKPYLELPDGTSAQGSKIWSGTGVPAAGTVGTAAAGDFYLFRRVASTPVLYVCTAGGTPGTWSKIVG